MELSSPPFVTSPRRVQDLSQSETSSPRSRVPRQQSVASASKVPGSPARQSMSSQVASPRYVKQFHALTEHQREVHSEERALWYTERADLHEKIAQLERSLRQSRALSPTQMSSPVDKNGTGSNSSFWSLLSTDGSRQPSASGTGEEVRHPKSDVQPTRTFSDMSNQPAKPESRLPSIAEKVNIRDRRDSQQIKSENQGPIHKPSINGSEIDKNLDGINFRSSSVAPDIVKNIMTPQSPSPGSASPSRISPATIDLPPPGLTASEDLYTKDAGHTPLARRGYFTTDGAASAPSSDAATPTQPEVERPPLEPHTTSVRPPTERSDSYFPAAEDNSNDVDPKLSGPLGLTNEEGEDKQFLSELDSKLLRAAQIDIFEPPAVAGASNMVGSAKEEEKEFEQPEAEPKLRIKRSMNFGSVFGARNCGKGF